MCSHCTDSNHEAPTRHDMTREDAELFAWDARRPRHIYPCGVAGCWTCDHVAARIAEAS